MAKIDDAELSGIPGGGAGHHQPGSLTRELERVEATNLAFYEAFTAQDLERMSRLWAQTPHVRCVHPGWELVTGFGEVRQSWSDIFASIEDIEITLNDVQLEILGSVAWVNLVVDMAITTDDGDQFEASVVTTNIFEATDGEWRMVLHHSSNFVEDDGDSDDGDGEEDTRVLGFFPPRSGSGPQSPN
ncbi:MAG: nuclear transport factor 2 family protein [Myxococcota bacterium]